MADKHNDGIEERAREFLVSVAVVGTGTLASFARTETATLTARVKELEAAIDAEPELPDEMPDEMWDAICGIVDVRDRPTMQELLRITVRTTKQGIKDRAKELLDR